MTKLVLDCHADAGYIEVAERQHGQLSRLDDHLQELHANLADINRRVHNIRSRLFGEAPTPTALKNTPDTDCSALDELWNVVNAISVRLTDLSDHIDTLELL